MRCLSCKYALSHLTEHRCPECGRGFDPHDPKSFDAAEDSAMKRRDTAFGIAFLIVAFLIPMVAIFLALRILASF